MLLINTHRLQLLGKLVVVSNDHHWHPLYPTPWWPETVVIPRGSRMRLASNFYNMNMCYIVQAHNSGCNELALRIPKRRSGAPDTQSPLHHARRHSPLLGARLSRGPQIAGHPAWPRKIGREAAQVHVRTGHKSDAEGRARQLPRVAQIPPNRQPGWATARRNGHTTETEPVKCARNWDSERSNCHLHERPSSSECNLRRSSAVSNDTATDNIGTCLRDGTINKTQFSNTNAKSPRCLSTSWIFPTRQPWWQPLELGSVWAVSWHREVVGSGPRYRILFLSQSRVRFSHGRRFFDSRNVQKCVTQIIVSGSNWPATPSLTRYERALLVHDSQEPQDPSGSAGMTRPSRAP